MPGLLPNRFLFRYSFPVRYERKLPKSGKKLLDLSSDFALPELGDLDGAKPFGELRLAWNQGGLGISVEVRGKKRAPQCDPRALETADGLRVFIDTRNTQNIHRASRYCHQFFLLPAGGDPDGAQPCGIQSPILRAREEAPLANPAELHLAGVVSKTGYLLEAWLPASALNGFDPEEQPRLGFYYALRDGELGEQCLTVGAEFPYAIDPSLWSTLELTGRQPA